MGGISRGLVGFTTLTMHIAILFFGLILTVSAQDTHYCPDGWLVSDVGGVIGCILLSGLQEKVTKADAEILCAYHEGWLVDLNEGWGPQMNNLLKSFLSDAEGQGQIGDAGMQWEDQWWIGATVDGPHSEHQYGNWTWDNSGAEIEWFDWMRDEPNDWEHDQNRMTFLRDQDIFGYYIYAWNDWNCDSTARYICERP